MGKLLVIRGGALGDFILTMPAIQLIREGFPDLEIEILGYPSITELAVSSGMADRTTSIEMATLAPFFAPGAELDKDLCEYFASFDVVVSYLYDPDEFLQQNLIRAGVETLICGPYRMEESLSSPPAAEQLAAPLNQLALFLEEPFIEVTYGKENDQLNQKIAIHPGSGSPRKNWSFESWVSLAKLIDNQLPNVTFLIISGEAEYETIADFIEMLESSKLTYEHMQSEALSDVGANLQTCNLFLGHDSGISHLAASTGVPGYILFGPSNPKVWAPQHPSFEFLQSTEGQLGNLDVQTVWKDPKFQEKLASIS